MTVKLVEMSLSFRTTSVTQVVDPHRVEGEERLMVLMPLPVNEWDKVELCLIVNEWETLSGEVYWTMVKLSREPEPLQALPNAPQACSIGDNPAVAQWVT